MAYVAISKQFIEDVKYNINNMRNTETNSLGQAPTIEATREILDMVEAQEWGEYLHLKDVIPDKWCVHAEGVRLWIHYPVDNEMNDTKIHMTDLHASPSQAVTFRVPPDGDRWCTSLKVMLQDFPVANALIAYVKSAEEVHERWTITRNKVVDYLNACKSLNEALKAYPDLVHYIPAQYRVRVKEIVVRKKAEPSEAVVAAEGLDKDMLLAGVVAVRLAQAA